jgi:hypothetical protein
VAATSELPADDAAIVRLVVGVVAAAVLCLFAGGVAGFVVVRDRPSPVLAPSGSLPGVVSTGGIGPLDGALVADYVTRRTDALRSASGRHVAVVSFVTYRSVDAARSAMAGTSGKRFLLALPGAPPVVAPTNPTKVLATSAERLRREADEMKALGDSTDDPPFKADYEAQARARRTQAAWAVDPRAQLVFAAVVVADAEALRGLTRTPGIRLVDIGPGGSVPSALRGLRPEEASTAGTPPLRPE